MPRVRQWSPRSCVARSNYCVIPPLRKRRPHDRTGTLAHSGSRKVERLLHDRDARFALRATNLKGAHDEGFRTLAIANRETERLYRSYAFVDEVIGIDHYGQFMDLVPQLEKRKMIIVPHGSFVAYLSLDEHSG